MVNKSLRTKIIVPTVIIFVFLVAVMIVYSSTRFLHYTEERVSSHITAAAKGLKNHMNLCEQISRAAAVSTALRHEVIRAIEVQDTIAIIDALTPLLPLYGVDYYTITDNQGIVLARMHDPEKFGDSVLGLRNVADAIGGNVSTYYEECAAVRVSVRTGAPVYDEDDRLIGVVSAGIRLDTDEAVDRLKEQFDTDFSVFLGDTRIATTIKRNGERISGTRLDPGIAEVVMSGDEFFGSSEILGERFITFYLPLINPDNEVFAILFSGSSREAMIEEANTVIINNILIGLAGLAFSIAVLLFIATKITGPVKGLLELVADVKNGVIREADGNYSVTKDEIGVLITDVYALIDTIKSMIGDLSRMTRELHLTGDIEFRIDTSKYSGLYKEIIDDIQDLGYSLSRMKKTMAVMDHMRTMVTVVDFDYNLIYANQSVAETYGIDIDSCIGQKCYKAIRKLNEPCSFCALDNLMQSDEPYPSTEYEYIWDEYSGKWMGQWETIIRWTDGSRVKCTFLNDETKTKQYEEQLKETAEYAQAMSEAKSSFLANMSHEIRTPMNAILGMSVLLKQERLTAHQADFVNDIFEAAGSLLSIINDILDFSKIESGKLELNPVDYDFKALVDNIGSMFSYVADKKGLDFSLECEGEIPQYLFGDDIRLRQTLTNICGNAIKFTDKGYIRFKITVLDGSLIFEVKDTGRGISKEDAPKLFTAFQQADTFKNRKTSGTGLGLAISKSFVDMMGGSISFESEYGQGTTFTIIIPIKPGDKNRVQDEKEEKEKLTIFAPTARILVVDDNEFNLRVACGILNLFKIKADIAESGKDGIDLVQRSNYDIVFMDHMMPEMDGIETTAAIRMLGERFSKIPIIALTANAVQGAKEIFLANGFNDFISKPIELHTLNMMLSAWLPPEKIIKAESFETNDEASDFMHALDKIDEINTKTGISRVSGIEEMYRDALVLFTRKVVPECDSMSAFIGTGDLSSFAIRVHAVKSMLSTIGAMSLTETSAKLESAATNGQMDYCSEHYPAYHTELLSLYEKLSHIFPEEEESSRTKTGDAAYLKEQLQKALLAADDLDNDTCMETLGDLLTYDFGASINAELEKAIDAVDNFDFDKAINILKEIAV